MSTPSASLHQAATAAGPVAVTAATSRRGRGYRRVEALVSLTDGRKVRGEVQSFNPKRRIVVLVLDDDGANAPPTEIPFERIRSVAFLADPGRTNLNPEFPKNARLVTLRLPDGDTVRGVTESFGNSRNGMYIVPVDSMWYHRIFVPMRAIREVLSSQTLDQFANGTGAVSLETVQRAIRRVPPEATAATTPARRGAGAGAQRPDVAKPLHEAGAARRKLGQVLIERGFLSRSELEEVLEAQGRSPDQRLGQLAVSMGLATHKMIGVALAIQYGVPFIDLKHEAIDTDLGRYVTPHFARRWHVVPVSLLQNVLTIAVADPTDPRPAAMLRREVGLEVVEVVAALHEIDHAIRRHFPV